MKFYAIMAVSGPNMHQFYVNRDISLRWRESIMHVYRPDEIGDALIEARTLGVECVPVEFEFPVKTVL